MILFFGFTTYGQYAANKKDAGIFFEKGEYVKAKRYFALCLAEDETDVAVKEGFEKANKCIELVEKAKGLSIENKKQEAVPLLLQVIKLNPGDKLIKGKHQEFFLLKPTELIENGDFEAAKILLLESKAFPYICLPCIQKLQTIEKFYNSFQKADSANNLKNYALATSLYYEALKINPKCNPCKDRLVKLKNTKEEQDSLERIKQKDFIGLWTLGNKYKDAAGKYYYTDYSKYANYMCSGLNLYNRSLELAADCKLCQSEKISQIKDTYIPECEGLEKAIKELRSVKKVTFGLGVISTSMAIYYTGKYKKEGDQNQKFLRDISVAGIGIIGGLSILIGNTKPEKLNCANL